MRLNLLAAPCRPGTSRSIPRPRYTNRPPGSLRAGLLLDRAVTGNHQISMRRAPYRCWFCCRHDLALLLSDMHTMGCCNWWMPKPLNVRFGSEADIKACITNVRFTPKSGHQGLEQRLRRILTSQLLSLHGAGHSFMRAATGGEFVSRGHMVCENNGNVT